MNKTIILDVDGVTILPRQKYLKDILKEDFDIEPAKVNPLFENEYYECVLGKRDLREILKNKYFPIWNWKGSVDEFFKYWWRNEESPNSVLLKIIDKYRAAENVRFCLLMEQEKYRAQHLLNDIGLINHFDKYYISSDYGISKRNKEFMELIMKDLNTTSDQIAVWDDTTANLEAPKILGINAYLFSDNEKFENDLQAFLR